MARNTKAICFLGNPGKLYAQTRHNFGFQCGERWLKRRPSNKKPKRELQSKVWVPEKNLVAFFPQTMMNLSGQAAQRVLHKYNVDVGNLLVVTDCLHLPLGRLKLSRNGSSAGQNGVHSIIESLRGDKSFCRLRLGIGGASRRTADTAKYVMSSWSPAQRPLAEQVIDEAVHVIDFWAEHGMERAMNKYN